MSDLVTRLRRWTHCDTVPPTALMAEAADEIERLRLTPDERQAITFLAHTDERQQWVRRSRLAFKSSLCRLLQRTKCATH